MYANLEMADLLFPHVHETVADIEARYPKRPLPPSAMVTRLAPSPTGELHVGTLYAAFISYRMAEQSGGVFYVRLDDTDNKRMVPGSGERIVREMAAYGVIPREGYQGDKPETGIYGPYVQSNRAALYHVCAKQLVAQGKAYPCFCNPDALTLIRDRQKAANVGTGYYGEWAMHRNITVREAAAEMAKGLPFTLRLRANITGHRLLMHDLFKGRLSLPENELDIILLKSDGLPTYHFAHAVDDTLMHTTHVLRGEEWLPSLPVHAALFDAIGKPLPTYGHLAPIMKQEGASKRKFSKRRDADGQVLYHLQRGLPTTALQEYYMHLINSNYEDWRRTNPSLPLTMYRIDLTNFGVSGPVMDWEKLAHIAKQYIAGLTADEAYASILTWAKVYDPSVHAAFAADRDYALHVLSLGRGGPNPRKDIACWSDVRGVLGFFFDPLFMPDTGGFTAHEQAFLKKYASHGQWTCGKDAWFENLKQIAATHGYAPSKAAYAKSPETYLGLLADAASALRGALTGRPQSPDLYDVMGILGAERVKARLHAASESAFKQCT